MHLLFYLYNLDNNFLRDLGIADTCHLGRATRKIHQQTQPLTDTVSSKRGIDRDISGKSHANTYHLAATRSWAMVDSLEASVLSPIPRQILEEASC